MEATVKLFRALPIKTKEQADNMDLMKETIKHGFIFAPEVIANYSNYSELVKLVADTTGLSAEKMNSAFHKSWTKVRDADLELLVVEQLANYLTTYGKEHPAMYLAEKGFQWGVEDLAEKVSELEDIDLTQVQDDYYIYIPKEVLDIPSIDVDKFPLLVIRGYTHEELKDKLLKLLESGVALAEDTLKSVLEIAMLVGFNEPEVEGIRNKEAKAALYEYLGLFPENPTEFLRFVIYIATSKTLLIKSPSLIQEIGESNNLNIVRTFSDYEAKYGLERLAEVFYRFKPLFLAFRTNKRMKVMVNRIRRLAVTHHRPLPEDYLNSITAKIKKGREIEVDKLEAELGKVNTFRKIRLAYALKFRTKDVDSILYRIRNGRGYATGFSFNRRAEAGEVLNVVLKSITQDVGKNVDRKKIYTPDHIKYSLPATEKQFTGNFPSGTCITIPSDMVVGIHWQNVKRDRIDLDLSLLSSEGGKIGWDALYRTRERDILFSGDETDAGGPKGASELFYIKSQAERSFIVLINYYNFDSSIEVPFSIIVAKEAVEDFGENYMVNPNNLLSLAESKISQKQKVLGLLVVSPNESKFYYAETALGWSITSTTSEPAMRSKKYLLDFYENSISLSDILLDAGAVLVNTQDEADIDLSPEKLEKDTIIQLIQ